MKFSIVMPTYNNKELLKNSLYSLNFQMGFSKNDYEVIVVDDGSDENTMEFIKGINKNYNLKYFYLKRTKDASRSRTRNYGWKNAEGEFVAFLDSDIIVQKNFLMELNRCFIEDKNSVVIGNRIMLNEKVSEKEIETNEVFNKYKFNKDNLNTLDSRYFTYEKASYNAKAIMCPWVLCYSCNIAVSKKNLEKINGFDENFKAWGIEDIEFGYKLYEQGLPIIINSKLEVYHQYHGRRNDLIIQKKNLKGYEENIDYFILKHPRALRMNKKNAYKFLEGNAKEDKVFSLIPYKEYFLDFRKGDDIENIKKSILELSNESKTKITVNDYCEDSNLDIWIQLLGKRNGIILYYPVSRRIDRMKMKEFLMEEKRIERQIDEKEIEV